MKRFLALLLGILTVCSLAGCSSNRPAPEATDAPEDFAPETTAAAQPADASDALPEAIDVPLPAETQQTDELQPSPEPTQAAYSYTLTALTDASFGFVCAYPTGWRNLPGKYTVCFREEVEAGDFPARVAITKKTLAHTPKSSTVLSQFQSYAETIYAQYDPATFEFGDLNSNAKFMGEQAYEITYLAYSGDIEVKGYMICCNIGRSIYVFHFCASYDDYGAMEGMMKQVRDSVTIAD